MFSVLRIVRLAVNVVSSKSQRVIQHQPAFRSIQATMSLSSDLSLEYIFIVEGGNKSRSIDVLR